jgi:hypothetical protein
MSNETDTCDVDLQSFAPTPNRYQVPGRVYESGRSRQQLEKFTIGYNSQNISMAIDRSLQTSKVSTENTVAQPSATGSYRPSPSSQLVSVDKKSLAPSRPESFQRSHLTQEVAVPDGFRKIQPRPAEVPAILHGSVSQNGPVRRTSDMLREIQSKGGVVPAIPPEPVSQQARTRSRPSGNVPGLCLVEGCEDYGSHFQNWLGHMNSAHSIQPVDSAGMEPGGLGVCRCWCGFFAESPMGLGRHKTQKHA